MAATAIQNNDDHHLSAIVDKAMNDVNRLRVRIFVKSFDDVEDIDNVSNSICAFVMQNIIWNPICVA